MESGKEGYVINRSVCNGLKRELKFVSEDDKAVPQRQREKFVVFSVGFGIPAFYTSLFIWVSPENDCKGRTSTHCARDRNLSSMLFNYFFRQR
jgi:hypothetical protein